MEESVSVTEKWNHGGYSPRPWSQGRYKKDGDFLLSLKHGMARTLSELNAYCPMPAVWEQLEKLIQEGQNWRRRGWPETGIRLSKLFPPLVCVVSCTVPRRGRRIGGPNLIVVTTIVRSSCRWCRWLFSDRRDWSTASKGWTINHVLQPTGETLFSRGSEPGLAGDSPTCWICSSVCPSSFVGWCMGLRGEVKSPGRFCS